MAKGRPIKKGVVLEDGPVVTEIGVSDVKEDNVNTIAEGLKESKVRYPGNWIKATLEEVKQYQNEGRLFGHDVDAGEVLIDIIKTGRAV